MRLVTAANAAIPPKSGLARIMTMSRTTNSGIYGRYRRWRRYRETVRELQGLSNRELSDLGIIRTDIGRLAREASNL